MIKLSLPDILFLLVLGLHGALHGLGAVQGFGWATLRGMRHRIGWRGGLLWLLAGLLFLLAAVLYGVGWEGWWGVAAGGVILSQGVIFAAWKDARAGTVLNLLIAVVVVLSAGLFFFERGYRRDRAFLHEAIQSASDSTSLVTEDDLRPLPPTVQQYLRYAGVVGRPTVRAMTAVMRGEMRERTGRRFPFVARQESRFDQPARLFWMEGHMFGVTVPGYHRYLDGRASMEVRLFGMIPVVSPAGGVLDRAETVTHFTDMCLMAPATLIDRRISWKILDPTRVEATFDSGPHQVRAVLTFAPDGRLVNFTSNDRTAVDVMRTLPFSTPLGAYRDFGPYRLAGRGEAVWEYPEGPFSYATIEIEQIRYSLP
ncbi:MAG: DUF6544 family protein [Blastocatellia bacterium]